MTQARDDRDFALEPRDVCRSRLAGGLSLLHADCAVKALTACSGFSDTSAGRASLPMPLIAIAPQDPPNAFAAGRDAEHAVVCVTEAIKGSAILIRFGSRSLAP